MDNTNLLGPTPPRGNTVFAENIQPPKAYSEPRLLTVALDIINHPILGYVCVPFVMAFMIACMAFPPLFLLVALVVILFVAHEFLAVCGFNVLGYLRREPEPIPLPPYAEAVKMLRESPNAIERNSVLIGAVAGTQVPVLVPTAVLMQNVHIIGPVGSYKTWMALLGIVSQMIAMRRFVTFYCCLKGDKGAMHFLRREARRVGLPFHVVTMDPELPSEVFNPLNQSCFRSPAERAAMILQVLGLNNASTVHGESYWQSMNATRAKRQMGAFPDCRSFRELDQAASLLGKGDLAKKLNYSVQELEHGAHFASEISILADPPCLNDLKAPQLDIMTLIRKPCVCVFLLPANLNKALAAKIRRFLLFTGNTSARKLGPDRPPIIFATDECHEALDSSEAPIFKSCRELLITQMNAHQEMQDLQMQHDKNILPMVTGNSRVAIYMGVRDAVGRKVIKETCGEMTRWLKSVDEQGREVLREADGVRITSSDFDYVNNTPGAAFVTIHEPEGFAVFRHTFICQLAGFPCSREEYEAFRRMPWPDIDGGATAATLDPPPEPEPPPQEKAAAVLEALAAMRAAHTSN
jgi:hypothetical protein